ncbi:MAG: ABC transporter substrate-binding protein [Candidatus Hodarchaeota archaeon]
MRKIGYFFLIIISICSISLALIQKPTESEVQGLKWYFDNLDDADRRKIRQAMDYAIPRQEIIDKLRGGLAGTPATEIAPNMIGYDDTIQGREYNITMAKTLMAEVFGKFYSNLTEIEPNDNITTIPYFSMVLLYPPRCCQPYLELQISQSFNEIGINTKLKSGGWNLIMPRIYLDPDSIGNNYDHDGFDAWSFSMISSPDPDLSASYYKDNFPPAGKNICWIENEEVTEIINRSLTDLDLENRLGALHDFQTWFYKEVPKSIIYQDFRFYPMDENLAGFDTYLTGRGWCFNNWSISGQSTLTYAVRSNFHDFNLLLSEYFEPQYSNIPMTNVLGTLAQRRGDYNLTHLVPQIAENWTHNEDGTIWEVLIRDGIKWDDGTPLTVEDVLFTYHAAFEATLRSPRRKFFLNRFPGKASNIYLKSGTNDTIVFELGAFFPYVTSQVFNLPILQKAQFENIPYIYWKTHPLNIGEEYIHGCGPYMMTDFDTETGVKLEINPYFNQNIFGHDPAAVGGGIWYSNPTIQKIYFPVVKSETNAIAGLSTGIYDVLDCNMLYHDYYYSELNAPDNDYNSKCILTSYYDWQVLNYNHYDSRWGMNAHDPREMYEVHGDIQNYIDSFSYYAQENIQEMIDNSFLTWSLAEAQNAALWMILIVVITIGMALFIKKMQEQSIHEKEEIISISARIINCPICGTNYRANICPKCGEPWEK